MSVDRHCPIPPHSRGQRGLGLPFLRGVQGSQERLSNLVLTDWVPCEPDLSWRTLPSSGELIRCQSNYDVCACSRGGVAMSGGDGRDISSQVLIVRRAWLPMYVLCLIWHLMTLSTEDAIFKIAFPVSEALGRGCVLS
jgi:hypothetical protein